MIQAPKTIQEENYLMQKLYSGSLNKLEKDMFDHFSKMYLDQVYHANEDMNLDELVRFYSVKSTFQLKVMYKILKDEQLKQDSHTILNLNVQAVNIIQSRY
jgi:hypothetical protein